MTRQRSLALAGRQKVKDGKEEGAGHAAQPAFVFAVVERVGAFAGQFDFPYEFVLVGDRRRREGTQLGPFDRRESLSMGHGRENRLADAGGVEGDLVSDLGEHATCTLGGDVGDVSRIVLVEHRHRNRFVQGDDGFRENRAEGHPEGAARIARKRDEPGAQGILPVRRLIDVTAGHERAQEAMGGGPRQLRLFANVRHADRRTGGGDDLEYAEGTAHSLYRGI